MHCRWNYHAAQLVTSLGLTFEAVVAAAMPSPRMTADVFACFGLVGLYVGIVPVALVMSPLQAHWDAERWEHMVSPDLQRRMESLIPRR